MAWVVGLIIPIALAPVSVNQRLPSGPAVIPGIATLPLGRGNSVMPEMPDSRQRSSSPSSRRSRRRIWP